MPFKAFVDLKERQSTSKKEIKDKKGENPPKEESKSKISKKTIDRKEFQQSHSR
ncbi:MAG TPA: hypothetical protein VKM55_29950 [Candidatus Lokiarchaeia archaeon]|nr:hypothetical protein [Candidatus Lokiarchaeia archaeon]